MGRVKAWAQDEFEKSLAVKEQQAGFGAQFKSSSKEEVLNQQDWAEFEKEFSAWLDAYEASFGDNL